MLLPTVTRRRMSGDGCSYSCLRSTPSVSLEHSVGHYLDLWGAVLGLTLFPIGYLLHALKWHA